MTRSLTNLRTWGQFFDFVLEKIFILFYFYFQHGRSPVKESEEKMDEEIEKDVEDSDDIDKDNSIQAGEE